MRATSIEDRQRWIDALQLAKRSHQSLIIAEQNGRYDSAMSLASASSLRKSGHNLKEKLAEMETFKDILSQQIDKLGAHIEQYGKVGGSSEPNHLMATGGGESDKPSIMDFKAEAITFKATANGVLFSLATCIEIFSRSEEHWRKKLEKEQIARRRAEEKYRLAVSIAKLLCYIVFQKSIYPIKHVTKCPILMRWGGRRDVYLLSLLIVYHVCH